MNKLIADIDRSNEKLKILQKRMADKIGINSETKEKIKKFEEKIDILNEQKNKTKIAHNIVEKEFKQEIEATKKVRDNMVDTIKSRAEKNNYQINYSKLKNGKIQLVLYR